MYLVSVVACQPMTVTNNKKVVRVRMSPWDLEMSIFNRAKEVADHRSISWRKVMGESLLLWLQAHPEQVAENTHKGTDEI